MAKFSSTLLAAEVEIRVADAKLKQDLAKAKAEVQRTTDAMTKASIASMKNRTQAGLREQKLEHQQSVRNIQSQIAANNLLAKANKAKQSEAKKAMAESARAERESAKEAREHAYQVGRATSAYRMLGVQVAIAGVIITIAFKKMLDQFTDFDRAMRRATAVTTFSLDQYTQMSAMAEKASMELNVSASSAADAFYYLGSAGLSAEDQMKAFRDVVILSKAAVIDASQAAEIMVDTMKGFKIPFEETAHVTAVMAKSVISSNMNFLQLGETLSLVAGVSRTTNNTLEETAAMIQLMANVGIKGTRSGTTLRRSMLNLAAPSEKINRLFEDMGVSISNQSGEIKPYIQLIGEISEAMKGAGEEQKMYAFKTLFGARAIAGQLEIFDAGRVKLLGMVTTLKTVGNTHEEIAEKQLAAFGEQVGEMQQTFANLSRQLTSKFVPTLQMMSKGLKGVAGWITKLADKAPFLSSLFTGTGLAMGGMTTAAGAAITTVASLSLVWQGLGAQSFLWAKTFGLFIAKLTGIGLIITATIAVIVGIISAFAKAKAEQDLWNKKLEESKRRTEEATKAHKEYRDELMKLGPSPAMLDILNDMDALSIKSLTAQQELIKIQEIISNFKNVKGANLKNIEEYAIRGLKARGEKPAPPNVYSAGGWGKPTVVEDTLVNLKKLATSIEKEIQKTTGVYNEEIDKMALAYEKTLTKTKKLHQAWSADVVNNVVSMIGEMKGQEAGYTKFMEEQLQNRLKDYRKDFEKKIWMTEEAKKLATAEHEHWLKLFEKRERKEIAYESAKRGDSFKMGFSSQASQMGDEVERLGEIGQKAADIFQQGIADSLGAAVRNAGNLKEAMISVVQSVENALLDMATQIIAKQLMSMMFSGMFDKSVDLSIAATNQTSATTMLAASTGNVTAGGEMIASSVAMNVAAGQMMAAAIMHGSSSGTSALGSIVGSAGMANFMSPAGPGGVPLPTGHSGGLVGSLSRSKRVSPLAFAGAPRLHGGLASDEMATILQRGEVVLSRNNVAELRDESGRQSKGSTSKPGSTGSIAVNIAITAMDSKSVLGALAPLKKEITSMVQSATRDNHVMRRNR